MKNKRLFVGHLAEAIVLTVYFFLVKTLLFKFTNSSSFSSRSRYYALRSIFFTQYTFKELAYNINYF